MAQSFLLTVDFSYNPGKASEVAGTVAFLASQEGDYITGQVIDINGGLYI